MNIFQKIWSNWKNARGTCKNCPLVDGDGYPLYGVGDWSSNVVVLAASPAYNLREPDDIDSSDFREVSKGFLSNRLSDPDNVLIEVLQTLTKDSSMSASDLYFTNVRKCKGEDSLDKARRTCKNYLKEEIVAVNPLLIVTFGTKAIEAVCSIYECDFNCKTVMWKHFIRSIDNRTLLAFPHWGYIMRQSPERRKRYWNDLPKKFKKAMGVVSEKTGWTFI